MTRQDQRRRVGHARAQARVGLEQRADILAQAQRAHEQNVLAAKPARLRRRRTSSAHAGRPGGQTCTRAGSSCSSRVTSPAAYCDDTIDRVRARGVRSRERRIVATNLGVHLIGMTKEIEVVNGDDLRGAASGSTTDSGCAPRRAVRQTIRSAAIRSGSTTTPARGPGP